VWRFVEANPQLYRHAPFFGEHNRELLTGLLGCSDDDLAQLIADKVIADAPINPSVG